MLINILACSIIMIGFGSAGYYESKNKKNPFVELGIYISGIIICLIFIGAI